MAINGISIILYETNTVGVDDFGADITEETPVIIDNVLVGTPTQDDIVNNTALYGRKATYSLGIPKGDTHNWENKTVHFFGQNFKTFGIPIEGIEENIPLSWNKKIMVERYE